MNGANGTNPATLFVSEARPQKKEKRVQKYIRLLKLSTAEKLSHAHKAAASKIAVKRPSRTVRRKLWCNMIHSVDDKQRNPTVSD